MKTIRHVFLNASYEPLEFISASILAILALAILNPFTDLYAEGYLYSLVKMYIHEIPFGLIVLLIAFNSFIALISGRMVWRKVSSTVTALTFAVTFGLFVEASPTVPFPWTLGLFSLVSLAVSARIHKDCKFNIPPWTAKP